MEKRSIRIAPGVSVDWRTCGALVVGSGAAGLNCAERLFDAGVRDVAVITSRMFGGTSYRSGSDKQTYYKLSVFGDTSDSPMEMAHSLFDGGAMDGDAAYIEGLGSLPAFYHLVASGVPFPRNDYGAFVGYKTDHDPRQRATSAGPKTSRFMVSGLLANVRSRGIPVLDRMTVVRLVTAGGRVAGLVALDERRSGGAGLGIAVFQSPVVVLATGGPGELYATSVYPAGQVGLHGLALEAGVALVNPGESQFGLASVKFRWNLSGTYQQVVPSYFSADGGGRKNFLAARYRSLAEMATNIFLKGYQWPFSAPRAEAFGSSLVDVAAEEERRAGRKVFLDFARNPTYPGERFDLAAMSPEAYGYVQRSGALQPTPYRRLAHMNPDAIAIYREHGIDLRDPLETAVCFQHHNGGLGVDASWETGVPGVFAAGEAAGTHGVARPGGSALNAGQVGGIRVAEEVSGRGPSRVTAAGTASLRRAAGAVLAESRRMLAAAGRPQRAVRAEVQRRMSAAAGFLRDGETLSAAADEARRELKAIRAVPPAASGKPELGRAWETRGLVIAHAAFLAGVDYYVREGGGSRGSYLVTAKPGEPGSGTVDTKSGPLLSFRRERIPDRTRKVVVSGKALRPSWKSVRPLPVDDSWFETVWGAWRRRSGR